MFEKLKYFSQKFIKGFFLMPKPSKSPNFGKLERSNKPILVKIEEIHIPKKDYPTTGQFPPSSPRFDELKAHMKRHGQLTPVFLDPNRVLIQGHYRLWAWKSLGETFIKAYVVNKPEEISKFFE